VTLVIIGALAAVSAPLFFDTATFQSRGFFDETVASVRYAQKRAVSTGCTVRVQIAAGGFTLFTAANQAACDTGPFATGVPDPTTGVAPFSRTAPEGVTMSAATIDFAPSGSASASTTVTVGARSFNVVAATGFVQGP
jgi:MSHA pilin protein MshC